MKGNKTLLISRHEVQELLTMSEVLKAVENAFILKAQGKAIMPAKIYLTLKEFGGDFRAMPAYIDGSAGMKWVSVYPNNAKYGLPSVMATILYCDPHNAYPLAIMDGTYITNMRTGAAGGVAVKHLARKGSSVIGMVGAGEQAITQLMAIKEVLPSIKEVKVFSRREESRTRFTNEMSQKLNLNIRPVDNVEAAADADIIVTTTFATVPVVFKRHVKPGTHINAIGADAEGKQELEGALTQACKIIVDDIEQASHSGEINVPLHKGEIEQSDIYGTLGEVAAKIKKGRENDRETTMFDSTGLAIQDLVCAKIVYEKAKGKKVASFDLLS